MTTITKITVNGLAHWNMGEATEDDARGYRAWLEGELEKAYPGVELELNEADATRSVLVETDEDDDGKLSGEVQEFLSEAWERCPWDWVKS